VINTRAPAEGSKSVISSGDVTLSYTSSHIPRRSASLWSAALAARATSAASAGAAPSTTASPAKLVRRPVRASWTPPNAGVKCAKAMGVLDCQRGLSNSTHPLHRRQTYLRHGCWPLLNQNGVEPIKRVHPAGKSWHSRRNPNKRPWS
jgi:hypothetical protein